MEDAYEIPPRLVPPSNWNVPKEEKQSGTKHDDGKADLSLLPKVGLEAEAKALMFGEKKYGRYSYTMGFDSHRLVAAAMRHIVAYQDGEDLDSESGLSHLAHAKACLAMMIHCISIGTLKDTRKKG
jgi:hypothetical protein